MTKKNKEKGRPLVKGSQKQIKASNLIQKNIPDEIEKSMGILPCVLGRLPIFLPLSKAIKLDGKTKLYFDNDELSFVGQSRKIKVIYVDGYLLTTQEEDLLIFLLRKAVKQGNKLVRTSYSEITRVVFGKKSPNRNIRTKIYETIEYLAKSEISIIDGNGTETTVGFISDRQRKTNEDYQHPLFIVLRDFIYTTVYESKGFYLQSISHRRKLRSPNLKRIYSFLCAINFKQISFRKIYDNCRIKQDYRKYKYRTITNPKLIDFLRIAKGCEIIIDKQRELVIFTQAIKGGNDE